MLKEMPDRKSNRSRKQVDYSKFGGGDDFDDDFANSTPPVSKKQKLSNKENKEKKKDKSNARAERKAVNRKTLEERLYEREMQAALELSLSQSEASQEAEPLPLLTDNSGSPNPSADPVDSPAPVLEKVGDCVIIPDDVAPPSPIVPTAETVTVAAPRKCSNPEDEIQVLETDIDVVPGTSGRRSKKPKKYVDSDSEDNDSEFAMDDEIESEDDSDDDYCEDDDDSDFDGGGKKRKRNSTSTPKPAATKAKKTAPKATKSTKNKDTKSVTKSTSKPATRPQKSSIAGVPARPSPLAAVRKTSSWTPPGRSGSEGTVSNNKTVSNTNNRTIGMKSQSVGLNVKSPSGGVTVKTSFTGAGLKSPTSGLRLGLSRNMKLKPLHPNLKIQN